MPRPISEIAKDIANEGGVKWATEPYIKAMYKMNSIHDKSARTVVIFFLASASGFKGVKAKQLKEELRALLDG